MNPYKTITGRTFDLSQLSPSEKQALEELTRVYNERPNWEEFSDLWQTTLRPILANAPSGKKKTQHPLYKIAQDLEMRLGIAQGLVAEPDYRDYLLDQIEEKFGSRYRFCKESGIPQAFLSQVLSGKKDFSVEMLRRAAKTLDLGLVLLPKADFAQPCANIFLALRQVIPVVVAELARVTDIHDNLRRYENPARRLQAFARERSLLKDDLFEELSCALEKFSSEARPEEVLRLLEEKREKLQLLLRFLREKAASLADEPTVLSKGEEPYGSPTVLRV